MTTTSKALNHLELFKEAGEWAKASGRTITPDMIELLGWLTGAASAWAEQFATGKESLPVAAGLVERLRDLDASGVAWASESADAIECLTADLADAKRLISQPPVQHKEQS